MSMRTQTADALSSELANRLHDVAHCPLATSAELRTLNGRALLSNVHRNIASLRESGLVQSVDFRSSVTGRASARHFLTSEGLRVLSEWLGQTASVTLRELPVSAEWQRVLLERIEILALVYRIAVQVAQCCTESGNDGQASVLFPRDDPLDGIISCADGRWFGVMRQGYGLSLSNLGRRIARQGRKRFQPAALFIVTADGLAMPPIMRRVLERRASLTGVIASEEDIPADEVDEAAWTLPNHLSGQPVSLRDLVLNAGGSAVYRPTVKTSYVKANRPVSLAHLPESRWAELTGAQRQTLDDIFLWPLMDIRQLAALRCVPYANKALSLSRLVDLGMIVRVRVRALPRRRFALSDEGLRYSSSRDRTSLSALRKRWSPGEDRQSAGTMLGKLQLESQHTEGVNDFAARLMTECGAETYVMPSHRAIRHFSDSGGASLVSPDLIAALYQNDSRQTLFLEYEMRATSPNPMRDKLLPWLRYFGTPYPHEDFQGDLRLLFVLQDERVEEAFHEVVNELHGRTGVSIPLATTHKDLLDQSAVALSDRIWQMQGSPSWERTTALSVRLTGRQSDGDFTGSRSERRADVVVSSSVPDFQVQPESPGGTQSLLGTYLRRVRNERQLSLRDVQRLARQHNLGASLSSGYLSVLERDGVKEPSPRILHTLATIYEIDYIDLLRRAGYIPSDASMAGSQQVTFTFRGASQLNSEQRRRVQHMIDFELNDSGETRRLGRPGNEEEGHHQ